MNYDDDDSSWQGAFSGPGISETVKRWKDFDLTEKWIVDQVIPAGAMHLIGGPSGSGKTTWLLQALHDWEQGKPLLNQFTSRPCPWIYVCCDRSLRETRKTLRRLGYDNWEFEAYGLEDLLPKSGNRISEAPDISKHILSKFPH